MRTTAIYVRQSVERPDSVSLETQEALCRSELPPETPEHTLSLRITFRSEIYIEAVSKEEAEEKFETMDIYSQEGLQNGEAWVETNSIEEA